MALFVDRELACRLEATRAWRGVQYARAQALLHPQSGATAEPMAGGYAVYAGAGSPLNHALGLGLRGPVCGPELGLVERFYSDRGSLPRMGLCPLADLSLQQLVADYRLEGFLSVCSGPR
ncbi:MAG: hypothetical protein FJ026_12170 [Chloroflexi bacterium]|nr:hypothetical protein [Chloroflexota bacterium]